MTGSVTLVGGVDVDGARRDLHIRDGVIVPAVADGVEVIRVADRVVAPAFVDLQVNGAGGIDLTAEPGRLWEVAAALPKFGVARFLPTIVTSPPATIEAARAGLLAGPPSAPTGALPLGLHLEGPMLAPSRVGAHNPAHLVPPSLDLVAGWAPSSGVAMVTLAPELPGAEAVVRHLVARGVLVAAGHTDADAEHARRAAGWGVRAATHLFNAMAPLGHRDPGLVGAILGGVPMCAGLIADGCHVDPAVLTLAWTALGPDRRFLVSDATAPLGMAPGRFRLGDRELVWDGRCVRDGAGHLAGSALGLDSAVRNAMAATGCSLGDAVDAASLTPARLVGHPGGCLRVGAPGDVVVLDGTTVVMTIVAGVVAFDDLRG